jgi:hypothetical protein
MGLGQVKPGMSRVIGIRECDRRLIFCNCSNGPRTGRKKSGGRCTRRRTGGGQGLGSNFYFFGNGLEFGKVIQGVIRPRSVALT